jgi:DNA-binding NarL/FixJ family response regulator
MGYMTPPYRVLLAEDHTMFREMIRKSLETIPGVEVAGEVGDGLKLLAAVETLKPHLVIVDIGLPEKSGLEAVQEIKKSHPDIKILLLTMYKTDDHLAQAMEAGVDGYVLKENAFNDLITAIETIRQGNLYFSNFVMNQMASIFIRRAKSRAQRPELRSPKGKSEFLSRREKEVLRYLAEGKSINEIAASLLIKVNTVRSHLSNTKRKLHINKTVELIRYAYKYGFASLT